MRHIASEQSRGIFRQLADLAGTTGVKTVIENHDAWLHNQVVVDEITAALRAQTAHRPRSSALVQRLQVQRQALAGLVVNLPQRIAHAG